MKIEYELSTKKVNAYYTVGEFNQKKANVIGLLDLGDGVDYDFTHDLDEYKVIGNNILFVGPDQVKLSSLEQERIQSITDRATEIIESAYSPLKQRKLLSIAVSIQDKQLQGGILSASEKAMLQSNRDANSWIAGIRTIENTEIENGTPVDSINWSV